MKTYQEVFKEIKYRLGKFGLFWIKSIPIFLITQMGINITTYIIIKFIKNKLNLKKAKNDKNMIINKIKLFNILNNF